MVSIVDGSENQGVGSGQKTSNASSQRSMLQSGLQVLTGQYSALLGRVNGSRPSSSTNGDNFNGLLNEASSSISSLNSSISKINDGSGGGGGFFDGIFDAAYSAAQKVINGIGSGISSIVQGAAKFVSSIYNSFVSQFQSSSNAQEDAPDNANCGPACLAIIAELFGKKTVTPENADATIEEMRRLMGASSDEYSFTSVSQLRAGAESMGLNAEVLSGADIDTLEEELNNGNAAIVNVDSRKYGGLYEYHFAVVTSIDKSRGVATILDPAFHYPIEVPLSQLQSAMAARGGYMVSIGDQGVVSEEEGPQGPQDDENGGNEPPITQDDNENTTDKPWWDMDISSWWKWFGLDEMFS